MIRFINKVEYADAAHLTGGEFCAEERLADLTGTVVPWTDLCIVGLASLEESEEMVNGARVHISVLKMTVCGQRKMGCDFPVFRCLCTDGTLLLVGTDTAPYPQTGYGRSYPDSAGNAARTTLTAQWVSAWPVMEITPPSMAGG